MTEKVPSSQPAPARDDGGARYRALAERFAAIVAAVPVELWEAPSPCAGWTARDVVRHVVEAPNRLFGLAGLETVELPPVDDDPLRAFRASSGAVAAARSDPARAGRTYTSPRGTAGLGAAIDSFLSVDLVVHGWDVATATRQGTEIEPDALAFLSASVAALSGAVGAGMRSSGAFGPALDPPPGADEQTKVLAFLGRRSW